MKARRPTEAERLARHNAEMKLALAENLSLSEARSRIAKERFLRLSRCGREAVALAPIEHGPLVPSSDPVPPHYWWMDL